MRPNDKLIAAVVAAVVLIGAVYVLLVSPERSQVSSLSAQIATEQGSLSSAQGSLNSARAAVTGYAGNVKELTQVVHAVPVNVDEPATIRTLDALAGTKIDVHEIALAPAGGVSQGPTELGLSLTFNATYSSLQSFITTLDRLVSTDGTNIAANGQLFTISGVSLNPNGDHDSTTKATITAADYSQTPGIFVGSTGATGATSVSSTAAVTP